MADEFCLKMPYFHVTYGTNGFTSLKNPTASSEFEPANLGTKGQHATSRPPKPVMNCSNSRLQISCSLEFSTFYVKKFQVTRTWFEQAAVPHRGMSVVERSSEGKNEAQNLERFGRGGISLW